MVQFRFSTIWLLGLGLLGITLLWATYNAYIPIFLQAGRPDFSEAPACGASAWAPASPGSS